MPHALYIHHRLRDDGEGERKRDRSRYCALRPPTCMLF